MIKMGVKESEKSVFIAYLLWLLGGFFGLHLFYLERDTHAFLTWTAFGGYGIGWLIDFLKIPEYVRDYNEEVNFMAELVYKMKRNKKPPFSTTRFVVASMIGCLWGQLILLAIPEDAVFGIDWSFLHWLTPFSAALGIWTVGNVGREQGKLWPSVGVAYLTYLSRWVFEDENIWLITMVLCTALYFDRYSKEWKRTPKQKRSFLKRISVLFVCGVVYFGLWCSCFYFNGTITDSNGDEIPMREALYHFFTSPWWTNFKQSLYDTYQFAQYHGWYEVWKQIIDLSDPQGEQNAYKVLGVSSSASQAEITSKWRLLSREWHPDKVKDPQLQQEAQEKFMEIQQAYEILSNIKSKRRRKNKRSVPDN